MKVLQVVPRRETESKLSSLLAQKERELRGSRTTFYRKGPARWAHKAYPGWITWSEAKGGLLVAQVHGPEDSEWQLLQSFVGYLDRHLSEHLDSITIFYR